MTRKVHFNYKGQEYIGIGEYEREVPYKYLDRNGDPPSEPPHGASFNLEELYLIKDGLDVDVTEIFEDFYEGHEMYQNGRPIGKNYSPIWDYLNEAAISAVRSGEERND